MGRFGLRSSVAALACVGASMGAAQDIVFSPDATRACLDSALPGGSIERCVGLSADQCMQANAAGYSTAGMSNCLHAESQWWEGRIETVYADLMAQSQEMDDANAPFAPSQIEALTAYRAAWEAHRLAKCDYVRSQWGGGTGGGPAFVSCMLSENARFFQDLQTSLLN